MKKLLTQILGSVICAVLVGDSASGQQPNIIEVHVIEFSAPGVLWNSASADANSLNSALIVDLKQFRQELTQKERAGQIAVRNVNADTVTSGKTITFSYGSVVVKNAQTQKVLRAIEAARSGADLTSAVIARITPQLILESAPGAEFVSFSINLRRNESAETVANIPIVKHSLSEAGNVVKLDQAAVYPLWRNSDATFSYLVVYFEAKRCGCPDAEK